jgi:2-deoxy-D-gluconate 3-dehydrogenase
VSGRDDDWLRDRFGLEGRTGLVTGARSGIGRATALALAAAGADLVLWGRTGSVDDVAAEVRALGQRATCVGADLTDLDALRATSARVIEQHEIHILVNNAGIIRRADARDVEWSDWRTVLDVNLDAVFTLCQAFGSAMLERHQGKIINIASLLSFQGGIRVPAYTASKHAVAGLTKALANEWAPAGVNVNAVAPGYVATDNTEPLRSDPEREAEIRGRIPAGRWAEATDIAETVAFLASPAADYIHGHVLVVDGGWMAR